MELELPEPVVSVIILNWNSAKYLQKCLRHVFSQTYKSIEVIFVDNGSTDGSFEFVQHAWGNRIHIHRNKANYGFPRGMNQGIDLSHGEYVLLLNSDMFLEPNFIRRAIDWLEKLGSRQVGVLGGIVYKYTDGSCGDEIDSTGWYLLPYQSVMNSRNTTEPEWVFGVAGSAPLYSRKALEVCRLPNGDYLDSSYFFYGEDTELYMRLHMMGWKCLFVPVTAGWHVGSASVGEAAYLHKPDHLQVHAIKNQFFTILTCCPLCLWPRMLRWTILAQAGLVAYALSRGDVRVLRNWIKAVWATGRMSGYLLKKRRWLQASRCVSCKYLRSLFTQQNTVETLRSLLQKI